MKTWYDAEGSRLDEPETRIIDTTVGRVIFNSILPPEVIFVNEVLEKGGVKDLIAEVYEICGQEVTTDVADKVKDIGFQYAMRSGITLAVADITVPSAKEEIIASALKEVELVQRDFRRGLLTDQEQNERIIQIWQKTTEDVAKAVRKNMDPNGNLATMGNSGATKGGFYGSFCRTFTMPKDVDEKKIEATFKDGMLTIGLPEVPHPKSKPV